MTIVKNKCIISFTVHLILTTLYTKVNTDDILTKPAAGNKNEVFLKDDTLHNWSSPQFPNPYPPESQSLIIKCDAGYSVLFFMRNLTLDGQSGDFLVVKPGTTLEENSEAIVFTYKLKDKYTYLVNSNSVIVSLQVFGNNEGEKTGFSLSYKRYGEAEEVITEPPTTSRPKPSLITVFVSGKTELEFSSVKVQTEFKIAVSKMAIDYCKSKKFLLTKEITDENVQIHYLTQCPFTWPQRDICTKIHFAVPIDVAENTTWSSYQLTTFHLNQMWNDLGNKYLEQFGMIIYTQSGSNSTTWWIIILCGTILLFSVLLFLLKVFSPINPTHDFIKTKIYGASKKHRFKYSRNIKINRHPYSQSVPSHDSTT